MVSIFFCFFSLENFHHSRIPFSIVSLANYYKKKNQRENLFYLLSWVRICQKRKKNTFEIEKITAAIATRLRLRLRCSGARCPHVPQVNVAYDEIRNPIPIKSLRKRNKGEGRCGGRGAGEGEHAILLSPSAVRSSATYARSLATHRMRMRMRMRIHTYVALQLARTSRHESTEANTAVRRKTSILYGLRRSRISWLAALRYVSLVWALLTSLFVFGSLRP